ncbi:MAG: PucR family transcriptional regulator [Brevibacillus sp.]|nr:PucR family transcriptional regulator [Brevibacillus sp.]
MGCTLKEILELPEMNSAKVCSAAHTIQHRPVEWVSVIEIPVENFVRKNELVLSTAIGCGHDAALLKQFVQDIIRSEAAALVLAKGHYVREVPAEVIAFASEQGFPIIEIPWEVRFSDITHAVLHEINNWQHRILEQSEEMQQIILHLFLHGKDFSAVAQALQQKIDHPVVIIDQHGGIKGESSKASLLTKQWYRTLEKHPDLLLWNPTTLHDSYTQHELKSCLIENHLIALFAIRSANQIQGYLVIAFPPDTNVETLLRMAMIHLIEKAAMASALWFQRETAIMETEMRLRGDFVWSLAKGEFDSWEQVLIRAKSFGYDMHATYVCLIGVPTNLRVVYKKQKNDHISFESWVQEVTTYLEEMMAQTAKTANKKIMITFQRNEFVVYYEADADQAGRQARDYIERVNQKIKQYLPDLVMSWGIGEVHTGEDSFQASYHDARTALEIGTRQKGDGAVTTYAETGIYRILRTLIHHEELRELTLQTIGKLFEHDKNRGMELLHTLTTYIRNHGNVSQTARALNLHRQSLLYRLKKIESLTGRSLTDPDDLFLIELTAKLWTAGVADEHNISFDMT